MKKETIVLGLGNPLMSDEGIGVYIINEFLKQKDKFPLVDFIDAGTAGLSVIHLLAGRKKAVFIDCAYMETLPGKIKRFTPEDVKSVKSLLHHSLHEADLLKIIECAKQLNQCPDDVIIFGIEPQNICPGRMLSPPLRDNIEKYIIAIASELNF
ncbi:MAG: hydrogenase maturation protease [Planctomycetota bacterium]|jgi:hydrogenase maturation protease